MVKYGFVLLAAPIVLSSAPIAMAQTAPAQSLDQISRHLRALTTMTANFSQSDRSGQVLTGTLTLKQPGRIRFQYEPSAKLLVVGDGKSLTMIDYAVNQVQRWPIGSSPLGALLNPERDLAKFGKLIPTRDPSVLSVEVRDPKRPEYGVITMIFTRDSAAPTGLRLDGWVSLDSKNNRTSIRLKDQRFGVAIPANSFAWTDPRKNRGPGR